jgi:succinate dehydrogenase / fumarate reductase cytochrome b subunit
MAKPKRAQNRPKNLDLMTIRLPMPALVSIMHRLSGGFLFLLLPLGLWVLQQSLTSAVEYQQIMSILQNRAIKIFDLIIFWAFSHHACAGIRHLALDANLGLRLKYARMSSRVVLFVSVMLTILLGSWLW